MSRILLVEDDLSLIDGLEYALCKAGFQVEVSRTVRDALTRIEAGQHDLLLLDLGLPDGSGFDICKRVRASSRMPIIFLTAADQEVSVVMGLDMGGDDYVTKPFRLNELISRINALLRRSGQETPPSELCSNGITVDLAQACAYKDGTRVELTAVEYRLLCLLMQNPNAALSRVTILERLWDADGRFVDDNTLSVYVSRLRAKLEDDPGQPALLQTVRGIGYRWRVDE